MATQDESLPSLHSKSGAKAPMPLVTSGPTAVSLLRGELLAKSPTSIVVFVEGNIGAGKTTLCRAIKEDDPDYVLVLEEAPNPKALDMFYDNPKVFGFAFQCVMQQHRIYQNELMLYAQRHSNDNRLIHLWDRSLVGDTIFAYQTYINGCMSDDQLDFYRALLPSKMPEGVMIFLDDSPEECQKRYRKRCSENGKGEKDVALDYFDSLDNLHFNLFLKMSAETPGRVTVVKWKAEGLHEDVMRAIHRVLVHPSDDFPSEEEKVAATMAHDTTGLEAHGGVGGEYHRRLQSLGFDWYAPQIRRFVMHHASLGHSLAIY